MIDLFVNLQENVCATANISSLVKSSFMFNGEHKVGVGSMHHQA